MKKKSFKHKYTLYYFDLRNSIPTYLITFAAGVFKTNFIKNSRCRVHGERKLMIKEYKRIRFDFAFCEKYLRYFEKHYGKFLFDRIEFLILPRDSPYAGMENPYVTFIAESIITGDRSLSSTVAHEVVHFWSGNMVTNSNWKHFWLNEGLTTYLSMKAIKHIHGEDQYLEGMKHGLFRLKEALKNHRE